MYEIVSWEDFDRYYVNFLVDGWYHARIALYEVRSTDDYEVLLAERLFPAIFASMPVHDKGLEIVQAEQPTKLLERYV